MRNRRKLLAVLLISLIICACQGQTMTEGPPSMPENKSGNQSPGGMRHDPGMHARHMAKIPEDYAGMNNPIASDDDSLERGRDLFALHCVSCHGQDGLGDGPAAVSLDPPPSPVAQTGRMMGDDYLFWRISEGGLQAPFNSAMPPWKDSLENNARWDIINYLRVLSSEKFNADDEAAQRKEVLAQAVSQGVISQEEADIFESVHAALDNYAAGQSGGFTGRMEDVQAQWLEALVDAGELSRAETETFIEVHDRLLEAGFMP